MPADLAHNLLSITRKIGDDNCSSFERCLDFVPYFEVDYDAFKSFMKRPWWSRVWVLQEFSSNPNTVFMCRKAETHADHILLAYMHLMMANQAGTRPNKQDLWKPWDWGRHRMTFVAA